MGLLDIFRRQEKASAVGGMTARFFVGNARWTPRNYEKLADEAYNRNVAAYRCVRLIAQCASTLPMQLINKKTKKPLDEHELLNLLNTPQPMKAGDEFLEKHFIFRLLAGNGYIESVGPRKGPPKELWNLRPDRMKVVPGNTGLPQGFVYTVNGESYKWDVDPLTGMSEVLHLKEPHPTDDWYGLPPVDPAAYSIDRMNAAQEYNTALLQNMANPSGALIFKPVTSNGVTKAPEKDIIDAAEERLYSRYSTPKNAGRPMVLSGEVEWEQFGLVPKDMEFNESKLDAARDICNAFGVPPILIVTGESTYNNLREAKLWLYEDTILPFAKKTLNGFNSWLVPQFGDNLELQFDLDEIPALSLRRERHQSRVLEQWNASLITADEAREKLGYEIDLTGLKRKPDATLLRQLSDMTANGTLPLDILLRYLQNVGLADEKMTVAQLEGLLLQQMEPTDDELDDQDDEPEDPDE